MNTAALKAFAPAVRRQLIEAVTRKLDFALSARTPDFLTTYAPQVAALRKLEKADRAGLIERVAYTWFNRLAALRFMDARGWHPFGARVLTPASAEETQPELLTLTRTGALPEELQGHTNPQRLNDLLDGKIPSPDAQGEVYRSLVLAACHFYYTLLPDVFEKLNDETELLLPDDLLTEQSVAHGFRTEIGDEDCSEVEILGWLYQFYISEKKDQVMARKSAVPTEDIPAVTQLFTPHWIVRYLVENSLGRLWLLNRPGSGLRQHMPYYTEGEAETDFLQIAKPEDIRLCDPAVGSGHMLTYAFDLLTLIYEEEGYAPSEIPGLILRHNLHGLEICPRAAQLAELALVFKAREKSRRFFQPEHLVRPRIVELRDVHFEEGELRDYIQGLGLADLFQQPVLALLHQFREAKNFGSLIQPSLDEKAIADLRRVIEAKNLGSELFLRETHLKVLRVLEQAEMLTQRYQVVVANPPYMGNGAMNSKLKVFVAENYSAGKSDLYGAFILQNLRLLLQRGMLGMITIPNWLFISSFEELRHLILDSCHFASLIQNGRGVWGGDFGSTAFVILNCRNPKHLGSFRRLFLKQGEIQSNKEIEANFQNTHSFPVFYASAIDFGEIPGNPIAFWASKKSIEAFQNNSVNDGFTAKKGMAIGDNAQFLRAWSEISFIHLGKHATNPLETKAHKWFPCLHGGEFRKWYGNNFLVVNWRNNGEEPKKCIVDRTGDHWSRYIISTDFFFRCGITWSAISASMIAARSYPSGFAFTSASMCAFDNTESVDYLILLLNSCVARYYLTILSPTVNYGIAEIKKLPIIKFELDIESKSRTDALIFIARADWDNFEISWDFRDLPLLRPELKGATLEASWRNWEAQSLAAIRRMQELETENNRLFITAYGLEGELQPEVPEAQITLARADTRKDMAAFLSYAVGCMMGRYSVDQPGLILANAGDSLEDYLAKVNRPLDGLTFTPDEDGIIPVLDGEWFEDDIVSRTRDFLRATFGEATLRENIRFIEDSLGKDLRKYFLTDFYKDHLQTYKKRPIYWLVQSPRKGFSVLLYLHRYSRDTMNLVLNRYLRDYQAKLRNRLAHVTELQITASTTKDKTEARKEAEKLTKTLAECDEWERQTLLPLAQARIELDLDDGVKVNYLKLGEALAPIAGLATKEDE